MFFVIIVIIVMIAIIVIIVILYYCYHGYYHYHGKVFSSCGLASAKTVPIRMVLLLRSGAHSYDFVWGNRDLFVRFCFGGFVRSERPPEST